MKSKAVVLTALLILSGAGYTAEEDHVPGGTNTVISGGTNTVEVGKELVVTSSSTASEAVKKPPYAPASVTVITKKDLVSRDIVSLADAIQHVEGVHILGGRKSGSISIRGMASDATLVLVDGRRLNTGFSDKANGMGEALEGNNIPPMEAIERIEIIRGPMSAVYGSDAMGGVINIITRKDAAKWTGSVGAGITVPENTDAGKQYQGDFYMAGPYIPDYLHLRIWGFKKWHEEDQIVNGFRQSDRRNISVALDFTPDEQNTVFGQISWTEQNMKTTPGNSSATNFTQTAEYDFAEQVLGHRGVYEWFKTDLQLYHKKTIRDGSHEPWKPVTENYLADAKATVPVSSHNLTAGGQWKEDSTQTDAGYMAWDLSFGKKSELREVAGFLEDEWAMFERFIATGGIRLVDNEKFGTHHTLRGYGVLLLGDAWTVKGGYAEGYKNPDVRETDPNIGNPQSWSNPRAYTWGNPDLKPQQSDTVEAGLYYDPESCFSFNATVFNTEYKNKIINTGQTRFYDEYGNLITSPDGKIWGTYLNIGEAVVRGVELAAKYRPVSTVTLRGNYTYTDSRMDTSDAVIKGPTNNIIVDWRFLDGKPLVGVPRNKINLSGEWQITSKLSIEIASNWQDGESNVDWSRTVARQSDYKMWDDDLLTVDTGVAYHLTDHVTFYGKVYNVTDATRTSDADYTYLEEGRRYWLSCRVSF
ncbi:MAG: TonB-dependent receptor [Pontiellaceae bacterium]|nr:TonB-dependent receptor [Pontiellaceae bacterium]